MTTRVQGNLITPLGVGMIATIRITAVSNGSSLLCSEAKVVTGDDGSYDFTLQDGVFDIEIKGDDEYCLNGTVETDVSTVPIVSLTELLTTYKYVAPVVV